jgi:membrane associated rhomboid family serine protease
MLPPFFNFFPIGDENRTRRLAWVTLVLIALNVTVFVAFGLAAPAGRYEALVARYGLTPVHAAAPTWITYQFLHGGLLHLVGNMLFLWAVAHKMEETLTRPGFAGFYLAGGVAAAAAHVLLYPTSTDPVIGASGAIAAVMGGYIVLFPRNRIKVAYLVWLLVYVRWGVWRMRSMWALGAWFAFNLVLSLAGPRSESGANVAYWAHTGGFAFGALVGLVLRATRLFRTPPALVAAALQERRGLAAGARLEHLELVRQIEEAVADGRLDRALGWYRRLLAGRSPAELAPPAEWALAERLEEDHAAPEAAAAYERLVMFSPADERAPEAALRAGLILARAPDQTAKARFYLRRAADSHPDPDRAAAARYALRQLEGPQAAR